MAQSLSAAVFSSFPHGPPARRRRRNLAAIPAKTSVPRLSSRRSFVMVGGVPPASGADMTGKPGGVDGGGTPEIADSAGISAKGKYSLPGLPVLPSTPIWLRWFLGFMFGVAIPLYGRFRSIERGVDKAAEVAEEVAKATKKVAEDIAEALPEDGSMMIRKVVQEVEEIADAVIADAEEVESIVDKVEEIAGKVEAVAEPIIKELEAHEKEGN